jgi:hypothetical protein
MAMMAMTTNSSMSVNPRESRAGCLVVEQSAFAFMNSCQLLDQTA